MSDLKTSKNITIWGNLQECRI